MEQNNQQQQFQCSGDCMKCNPMQRQYCAAQWSLNSMRMLAAMQQSLTAMQGTVDGLRAKLDAIQGSEASLFDPTKSDAAPQTAARTSDQPEGSAEAEIPFDGKA